VPQQQTPTELVRAARDHIQALNHTTMRLESMPYAGEISSTVQALIDLVDRLPQSLDQLGVGLREIEKRDGIRLDHDASVRQEVQLAMEGLEEARKALGPVSVALQKAAGPLFHMGAPYPPDEDDDEY